MLIGLALICLMPIWVMVVTSLREQVSILQADPVWLWFAPTLDHYQSVLGHRRFERYLLNSLFVATASTFLTLLLGGLSAYALARKRFFGRQLVANLTLLMRMVPPAVLAVPAFSIVLMLQLESDLLVLIFFYTALNLPFAIWLLYGFYQQIPQELEEAAIVDGANPLQVFFYVLLPLVRGGYAVTAIFTFRIAWNEFILALLLTGRSTRTLPVALSGFLTDTGVDWGRMMAMGTLIVIPPLLFTLFAARQIIAGLAAGAVKG
jgi:multiple sugar transport system permease protein